MSFIQTDLEKNQVQKKSFISVIFTRELKSNCSAGRPPKGSHTSRCFMVLNFFIYAGGYNKEETGRIGLF